MPRDRDEESGQFEETATDEDILRYIAEFERPFITNSEVMEGFNLGRTSINNRLNELAQEDRLNKTEVGSRAVVWWLPSTEDESSSESAEYDATEYMDEDESTEYEDWKANLAPWLDEDEVIEVSVPHKAG